MMPLPRVGGAVRGARQGQPRQRARGHLSSGAVARSPPAQSPSPNAGLQLTGGLCVGETRQAGVRGGFAVDLGRGAVQFDGQHPLLQPRALRQRYRWYALRPFFGASPQFHQLNDRLSLGLVSEVPMNSVRAEVRLVDKPARPSWWRCAPLCPLPLSLFGSVSLCCGGEHDGSRWLLWP